RTSRTNAAIFDHAIHTRNVEIPPGVSAKRRLVSNAAPGHSGMLRRLLYQFGWLGESYFYPLLECYYWPLRWPCYRQDTPFTAADPTCCRLSHRPLALDLAHQRYRLSRLLGIIDSGHRSSTDRSQPHE